MQTERQTLANVLAGCAAVVLFSVCGTSTATGAPAPSVVAPPGLASTYYLFSFTEAEIGEVATAVLGEALTYTFSIDDGVTGTMTFRVADPMTEDQLLDRFAEALAEREVALVRVDGGLRLAPRAVALAQRPQLDIIGVRAPPVVLAAPAGAAAGSVAEAVNSLEAEANDGRSWILVLAGLLAVAGLAMALLANRTRVVQIWHRRVGPARPASHAGTREAVVDALLKAHPVGLAALAGACDAAAKQGRPVEQVLRRQGAVSDEALAQAYATVGGLAIWDPASKPRLSAPPGLEGFARSLHATDMALVAADDWSVTVATADPFDDSAFNALCRGSGRMVTLLVARWSDVTGQGQTVADPANDVDADALGPLAGPAGRRGRRDGAVLLQEILARNAEAVEGTARTAS